ncbi:RICIN domain-containing protein [Streptomyces erythrochromogenes]|uniref:RICIN domain-containing protein n=1 Tax=Streptomyces erythrochromogenes TaxID=285574 RepID=UPI0036F7E03E
MNEPQPAQRHHGRNLLIATSLAALIAGGLMVNASAGQDPAGEAAADTAVAQLAEPGAQLATAKVSGDGSQATSSAERRVCADGAGWMRLRFADLKLRGSDTITLTGSSGGSYTLTSAHTAATGKEFFTRAFGGSCVSVAPRLTQPGSSFSIDAHQSGKQALAAASVRVAAAGDICGEACNQTAPVVSAMSPAAVITAGDNAYESGKLSEFNGSYDKNWGKFNSIVHPSPGNHEYKTSGAKGYFDYYQGKGVKTGDRDKGYYSVDVGDWHLVSLNSNVSTGAGSAQEKWLRADLASSTKPCTMAYWHHARFSSGDHGDSSGTAPLLKALTDFKADVAVWGHDHHYERFAPAMSNGTKDTANGIRSFVIGTGGRALYSKRGSSAGPSEVFNNNTYGVGQFDLTSTGYAFAFKPVSGRTFTDSVSGTCHAKANNPGPGPTPTPTSTGPTPTPTSTGPTPTPTPTPTSTPDPGGPITSGTTYQLLNAGSGKVLDSPAKNGEGGYLVQWTGGNFNNQKFTATKNPDNSYQLKVKSNGLCVAGAPGSTSDGTAVQQRTCSTAEDQKWKIAAAGAGLALTAQHSGKCLDVTGSSKADGARIVQTSCDGRSSQQWKFNTAT